jgi:hypothetical protein
MQIFARTAGTGFTVFNEALLKQREVVGFGAKVANVSAQVARLTDGSVHFRACEMMKAVAFKSGSVQAKLLKNLSKSDAGGCGSGAA